MGSFLTVLGSILVILCGGCTVLAIVSSGLDDPFIGLVFLFGGLPALLGLVLLVIGLAVNKHKENQSIKDTELGE